MWWYWISGRSARLGLDLNAAMPSMTKTVLASAGHKAVLIFGQGALLLRHFLYSLNGCRQGAVIEGQWNVAYFWHQSEGPLNAQRS